MRAAATSHRPPWRCAVALAALAAVVAGAPPAQAARPTGRYLVSFQAPSTARSASGVAAVLSRAGARRAGRGVPELRIATVRGSSSAVARLRREPSVRSVSVEWERDLRRFPSDPALAEAETQFTTGVPGGTPIQWAPARQGFLRAWDFATGRGAIVGALDTGVDGGNPDFAGKIASADGVGAGAPLSDDDGHGSHTAGLACAATDNAIGVAGAGFGCRLAVVKLGLTPVTESIRDEDIVDGIRLATDRGADAINMSFGGGATNAALRQAVDYAVARGVVLVASASNDSTSDQGAPAVELQPGDAPNLSAGRGLVVTAAEFDDTGAGTGFGDQISLAAYGFFDDGLNGPPGLISTYPRNGTPREGVTFLDGCQCRRSLSDGSHYAYLQGTSMSAPQVAGLAALVSDLNPFLSLRDKLTLIKQSARGADWTPELGWGIIDAAAAVEAGRRIDKLAPTSRARAKRRHRVRRGRKRARVRVKWRGSDPGGAPGLVPAGVRNYDLYAKRGRGRYRRIRRDTRRRSALLRLRPGVYRFYTRARDRAGNREAKPRRADVRVRVRRPRRR